MHFDFNLPLDEKNIEVAEDNETVDVCIKLVSTGSHDSLQTPVVVKLDFEDQSAKGIYILEECNALLARYATVYIGVDH